MARRLNEIVPVQQVEGLIYLIRGQKVMLDRDLAALYGVETRTLNQAVKRNLTRFPADFMFRLTEEEATNSSQFVMSSETTMRHPDGTRTQKHRGKTYRPYAFTEQGVAMLSSVLRSTRAVQVNIEIMRAFVKIRQWLLSNSDLSRRLSALEKKYDAQFKAVFDAIRDLMTQPSGAESHKEIGFHTAQRKSDNKAKVSKV